MYRLVLLQPTKSLKKMIIHDFKIKTNSYEMSNYNPLGKHRAVKIMPTLALVEPSETVSGLNLTIPIRTELQGGVSSKKVSKILFQSSPYVGLTKGEILF